MHRRICVVGASRESGRGEGHVAEGRATWHTGAGHKGSGQITARARWRGAATGVSAEFRLDSLPHAPSVIWEIEMGDRIWRGRVRARSATLCSKIMSVNVGDAESMKMAPRPSSWPPQLRMVSPEMTTEGGSELLKVKKRERPPCVAGMRRRGRLHDGYMTVT